jgi:hypothetical protein
MKIKFINLIVITFFSAYLFAQAPLNDEISGAITLCQNTDTTGSTALATQGTDENTLCNITPTAPGVWYSFTGNGNNIELSTCLGSSYDTRLFLYTGTSGALTCVAENDDFCGNKSQISFQSTQNQAYLLLVSGYSSNTGTFSLKIVSVDSIIVDACVDYTSPSGNLYTNSTQFYDTLISIDGCDSITFIDLNIYQDIITTLTVLSNTECSELNKDTIEAISSSPLVNNHKWYDAPIGGNLLYKGDVFKPLIDKSTTFYVVPNANIPAPMPATTDSSSSIGTGGYWFTAPNTFTITSLFVPDFNSSITQNISVIKMNNGNSPPTAALTTNDFSTVYLTQANPTSGPVSVNIPIYAGEVIGIFGSRGSSYSTLSNTDNYTIINGDTAYLTKLGFANELITTSPQNISDFSFSSNIDIVEFEYINTDICIPSTRTPIFVEVFKNYLDTIIVQTCDSFTSPIGDLYTGSSTFNDTLSSINGCDSVVFVDLTLEYTTSDSLNIIACDSFISPSGKIFTSSTIFTDTLYTNVGCHQYKHIDLTIGNSTLDSIDVIACDTYTSPNGTERIQSAMFYDTLSSTLGCDSTVFVDLTVNFSYLSAFSLAVCDSFISAQGDVYDTSSVFFDTLTTSLGCDSVLYTTLTVNNSTMTNLIVEVCDSYTSPNNTLYTASAIFSDTLFSINGCDSIFNIDLVVNNTQVTNINVTECNSYISPLGDTYTNSTNIQDTLATIHGCDSIVNVNLTINYSTLDSIYPEVCGTYTSPLGNVFTSTSYFNETYTTSAGCDSVVTIFLTVHQEEVIDINPFICGTYISPMGNIYTSSTIFTEVLTATFGCDSTYNINLTIPNVVSSQITPIVCNEYISPLGFTFTDSQIFSEILVANNGCDSTVNINLTIHKTQFDTISIAACGEYISPEGIQYLSSGYYTEDFTSVFGCDSFFVIDVEINPIDTTVDKFHDLLSSLEFGATYQWYECEGNKIIANATDRQFTAPENGRYHVVIENGSCLDTSECVSVNSITTIHSLNYLGLKVYPNPTKNILHVDMTYLNYNQSYIIYDITGKIIQFGDFKAEENSINVATFESGIYFLMIQNDEKQIIEPIRFIKN